MDHIRKLHIWQMLHIGTNSSYGCEIYEMRNLRFNKAFIRKSSIQFWVISVAKAPVAFCITKALKGYRILIRHRVCVYSNSRNDVPRVAQRYGTIAAHTRCRASVLVVFVVFGVHMYSFAGLIRRTPPPTFSDTAITDRHSDTAIFQLRAHWVRIS